MHKAEPYATPISESAPSERMARSGRESRYLYRAAGLTLYSIKTASELRSDAQGGALCHSAEQPREEAAAVSWHEPLIGGTGGGFRKFCRFGRSEQQVLRAGIT